MKFHQLLLKFSIQPDTVRLGDGDLYSPSDDWNVQQYRIKIFIIHPQYKSFYNDIGLIKTDKKISFNKNVFPSCIAEFGDENIKGPWWVDGYGEVLKK